MIKLEDKLYTSTEVADILGVSLRSVYRYIEEDKLVPEVKTATGRHRFTKQNILDFLYPNGESQEDNQSSSKSHASRPVREDPFKREEKPVERMKTKEKVEESVTEEEDVTEEEPIDWLAKFREAAKKFEEPTKPVYPTKKEEPAVVEEPAFAKESFGGFTKEEVIEEPAQTMFYYRSRLGGLKDIAQNIDKTSRNSGLDYAFTMNSGLSLYKAIKPFSMLHAYVRSKDKDFFERILMLTPSDENNAQLCLIVSDEGRIYDTKDELHGLFVVSKSKLAEDIKSSDDSTLIEESRSILG